MSHERREITGLRTSESLFGVFCSEGRGHRIVQDVSIQHTHCENEANKGQERGIRGIRGIS